MKKYCNYLNFYIIIIFNRLKLFILIIIIFNRLKLFILIIILEMFLYTYFFL